VHYVGRRGTQAGGEVEKVFQVGLVDGVADDFDVEVIEI
jgi:hypothetical protein